MREYYLSNNGDDNNTGTSLNAPWKTIDRLLEQNISNGDKIYLRANDLFETYNPISITNKNNITIRSFGKGSAVLLINNSNGIELENSKNITLDCIDLRANITNNNLYNGIKLNNTEKISLWNISIHNSQICGFSKFGIVGINEKDPFGFSNLLIDKCNVHDNVYGGIYLGSSRMEEYCRSKYYYIMNKKLKEIKYSHKKINITDCNVYNNTGIQGHWTHSGSGIFIEDCDELLIQGCKAWNNGTLCDSIVGGATGIWVANTNNALMRYNESFNNKTNGKLDGGGFDLDGGVTNSTISYSKSYLNDGAGIMLYNYRGAPFNFGNNLVEFNICYENGIKNFYSDIQCGGYSQNSIIRNNIILKSTNTSPLLTINDENRNLSFIQNRFINKSKGLLFRNDGKHENLIFENNLISSDNEVKIEWNNKLFDSLNEWLQVYGENKWCTECDKIYSSDAKQRDHSYPEINIKQKLEVQGKHFYLGNQRVFIKAITISNNQDDYDEIGNSCIYEGINAEYIVENTTKKNNVIRILELEYSSDLWKILPNLWKTRFDFLPIQIEPSTVSDCHAVVINFPDHFPAFSVPIDILKKAIGKIIQFLNKDFGLLVGLKANGYLIEKLNSIFHFIVAEINDKNLKFLNVEIQFLQLLSLNKPLLCQRSVNLENVQDIWIDKKLAFEGAAGFINRYNNIDRTKVYPTLKSMDYLPFPHNLPWPSIAIVVACYNEEEYIDQCIKHLLELEYPNFEIIAVDNSSTDNTFNILNKYPIKVVKSEKGLCKARNTGLKSSEADIIAFIDADAFPDTTWLRYIALRFLTTEKVAIGGPLLPPKNISNKRRSIGFAPGNPQAVRKDLSESEHLAGCNLAVYRKNLEAIGGFDINLGAGDDVDICWRLLKKGWTLGYHPNALVWHYPRKTIFSFWKQQKSYGTGEINLERKWPEKFNKNGGIKWSKGIYSNIRKEGFENKEKNDSISKKDKKIGKLLNENNTGTFLGYIHSPNLYKYFTVLLIISLSILHKDARIIGMIIVSIIALLIGSGSLLISRRIVSKYNRNTTLLEVLFMSFLVITQPIARLLGWFHGRNQLLKAAIKNIDIFKLFGRLSYCVESPNNKSKIENLLKQKLNHQPVTVKTRIDEEVWDLELIIIGFASILIFNINKYKLFIKPHISKKNIIVIIALIICLPIIFFIQEYLLFAFLSIFLITWIVIILIELTTISFFVKQILQSI
jgi:cellulose synthase/poly-beta-1,6-N-acetylglucosamine synthase-like glycosyltransferase